ncbi:hypothetical protein [Paenibacillus durus]|uniref:Uncharacterized protein n=1 Tax=Paenibacillus durus ATCC 35681 TaxID=1333534 RepID=A0A0F7CJS5_PAEDU|nr:hypothetical protein [Paenibacillus durus]AKG36436.1 hypothetical protein VK70_19360 [Paenibacillus durus ATCC 35681]
MNEKLLIQWRDKYLNNDDTYSNHVNKFVAYIDEIGKSDQPENITRDDLIGSIEKYHFLGSIRTRSSMHNHLEAVKDFYKFMVSKHYTNDLFNNLASYKEFKNMIAHKFDLPALQSRGFREEEDIIKLLEHLDTYFDVISYDNNLRVNEKKRYIKFLILRIFIKLTLIAPAKKAIICSLKREDFDDDFRSVMINATKIRIPNGLRRDIISSVNTISAIKLAEFKNENLLFDFLYLKKFKVELLNDFFKTFLMRTEAIDIDLSSFQLEVIMNSALNSLIKNGANLALVSQISGVKISSLEKKFLTNKTYNMDTELINSEISRSLYYNYI